jgi:hypothetical protein
VTQDPETALAQPLHIGHSALVPTPEEVSSSEHLARVVNKREVVYEKRRTWWKPWIAWRRTPVDFVAMKGPEVLLRGEHGRFGFEIVEGREHVCELDIVDWDQESSVSNGFDSVDQAKQVAESFAGGPILWQAPDEAFGRPDYESIQQATDELTRRGWRRFSLNDALGAWEQFVETVESGYTMTIDDYTNDASIRRWPEDARAFVTARVAASFDARLVQIDARFRQATTEASRRLPGGGEGWWARRIPKVLVGELAEDVARMQLG